MKTAISAQKHHYALRTRKDPVAKDTHKIIAGLAGDLLDTLVDKIARQVATRFVVRRTVIIQRIVIVSGRSVRVVIARRPVSFSSAVVVGRTVSVRRPVFCGSAVVVGRAVVVVVSG